MPKDAWFQCWKVATTFKPLALRLPRMFGRLRSAMIPADEHLWRPLKAGERPNGRRRLCGEAKRAEARAGV